MVPGAAFPISSLNLVMMICGEDMTGLKMGVEPGS